MELAYNHVHFTVAEIGTDVVQHGYTVKLLYYVLNFYQFSIKLVSTTSNNNITILLFTTALVLALPTSSAPP